MRNSSSAEWPSADTWPPPEAGELTSTAEGTARRLRVTSATAARKAGSVALSRRFGPARPRCWGQAGLFERDLGAARLAGSRLRRWSAP